jgi:hypothetical protein
MVIALTLQYLPEDQRAEPVTVHATTSPELLLAFRECVLRDAHERAATAPDGTAAAIEALEEVRLRQVLDLVLPDE